MSLGFVINSAIVTRLTALPRRSASWPRGSEEPAIAGNELLPWTVCNLQLCVCLVAAVVDGMAICPVPARKLPARDQQVSVILSSTSGVGSWSSPPSRTLTTLLQSRRASPSSMRLTRLRAKAISMFASSPARPPDPRWRIYLPRPGQLSASCPSGRGLAPAWSLRSRSRRSGNPSSGRFARIGGMLAEA